MVRTQRLIGAAILVVLAVSACGHGGAQQQGPPPLAVDVAKAQRQDIATYINLDGQITPRQDATLSTPQSGTVAAVYVYEGQRVHAGELLAQLDDSTLRAQLAQAVAQVAQAQASLGGATLQGNVTPSQALTTIATAQQQLAAAKATTQTDIAALQNAKLVNDSNQTLYGQGYVAQTTAEQSRAAYVQAEQALAAAREQQREAEVALVNAKASGQNAVPIQNQTIAGTRASLASSQAQVKLLEAQIAQARLIAPFDGVITNRLLDPGAFAGPNQGIVEISQIDTVYVNINVPDNDLPWVHKGTAVTFTSTSTPGRTFEGEIFDVNATPTTGTLSYRARVVKTNPDNALRGGMLVSVNVRKDIHRNVIVVPLTALVQGDSGSAVYTVVPLPPPPGAASGAGGGAPPAGAAAAGPPKPQLTFAQAKLVPVTVGLQTDVTAEVDSPAINAGTVVITTRPDSLQDKSTVAYTPPVAGTRPPPGTTAELTTP
jgi:multidrug efflux pump subunit AcrA (membrane-fusion protein)